MLLLRKEYWETRFKKYFGWCYEQINDETGEFGWHFRTAPKEIIFRNGYRKNAPEFTAEVVVVEKTGKPEWGAMPDEIYYVLQIQRIYNVRNVKEECVMNENVVSMFGIELFEHDGYYEATDDGNQYHVLKWLLKDMEQYNEKDTFLSFDGIVKVYNETGELLFEKWLHEIIDFAEQVLAKIDALAK